MKNDSDWERDLDSLAKEAGELFENFVKTVGRLRHPVKGCPWDLKQDHKSLRRFMLEEAYEAAAAMLDGDREEIAEELGDVLLQVVLNGQVCKDVGQGDIRDIIKKINSKMIRRHPHVFSADPTQGEVSIESVKLNWELIKKQEKQSSKLYKGTFSELYRVQPALTQAFKIGKKSSEIAFDWTDVGTVFEQFKAEIAELEQEVQSGDSMKIQAELGDVFFTLAQLSRHLGLEPESVAQGGNHKFLSRFEIMESLAEDLQLDIRDLSSSQLEELWQKAKKQQKPNEV